MIQQTDLAGFTSEKITTCATHRANAGKADYCADPLCECTQAPMFAIELVFGFKSNFRSGSPADSHNCNSSRFRAAYTQLLCLINYSNRFESGRFFACVCPSCSFTSRHSFCPGSYISMKEFRLWQRLDRHRTYLNVVYTSYTTWSKNL